MSLREFRRHAGRLAVVGFTGHSVPDALRDIVASFDLGGVIYFARNIAEPVQVLELSREVAALRRDWPLWIAVDQEGGRVARLKSPFTEWPPAITLGRSGDESLARRFAGALAAELAAVGINLNTAPVLDVLTRRENPAVGDRALAERAEDVARLGVAIATALQAAGVAACGKHFPGHGDTGVDSHEELPVLEHDRRRLDAVELVPFRRAIEAGIAAIMTAHLLVLPLDEERPASMSPRIVQQLLKDALGFQGVVFSDDLGMKAVSATRSLGEAAVDAIAAGTDAVLLCNSSPEEQMIAIETIIRARETDRIAATRVDDAFRRQRLVKERFLAPSARRDAGPVGIIGSAAHRAVAKDMAAWL
jgi:beta-N-acetylhexosaminidase